jgi:membrane fusion protein, heavy metal efflux system
MKSLIWKIGGIGTLVAATGIYLYSKQVHSEINGHDHGEKSSGDDHSSHGHDEHKESQNSIEVKETAQKLAGIKVKQALASSIQSTIVLNGRIFPNQNKLAQIVSRYPGLVKKVYKDLGESVQAKESLASIEANGSLSVFPIKSKIKGTVIRKKIIPGEFVSDKEILFEVSDLSVVWVDLNVTEKDFGLIKKGQKVFIRMWDHDAVVETELIYVSPLIHSDSQTLLARAKIGNQNGRWRPGSFVTAEVVVEVKSAEVAVSENAIQLIDEKPVVFVKTGGETFEVREVETGLRGRGMIEITEGIEKSENYVHANSFVLKAELLKSMAGHDHGH